MLAFPQAQLQAFRDRDRQHYGLRLKVGATVGPDPQCTLAWIWEHVQTVCSWSFVSAFLPISIR